MGTGINRIKKFLKEANCPTPNFEFGSFFTLTFNRVGVDLLKSETLDTTQETSVKTREKIIESIRQDPRITTRELAVLLDITPKGVEWQLNRMKQQKLIKRIGPVKGGHLEVIE